MLGPHWTRLALGVAVAAASLAGCSKSARTYVERGDAQFEKGHVDAAVLEYRNAVKKDPMFAPARLKLAEAYLRQGNGAGALGESVRAADLLPRDSAAQLKAGRLLLAAGRAQDALGRADKALAIDSKSVDALVLRANALAGTSSLDAAIEQMQQAIALEPTASSQANLGALQAARGRPREAEAAFQQAIATDPRSVTAHLALGQFLSTTGRAEEAEGAFKAALALDAGNLIANRALALFYIGSNRGPEAEPYLKKVADVGKDPASILALADYYAAMQRNADALSVLEGLSRMPQGWAAARSRTAALLFADGKKADAYKAIDDVIARRPGYSEARVVRGRFLLAEGKADEALAEAQEAAKSEPRNAEAHFLLGSIRKAKHDLDAAAAAFSEVLRLNPAATAAQVQLAGIELQRGEFARAAQMAEEAARREPRSLEAQLVLVRSVNASGELDRAAAVTRRMLDLFPLSGAVHAEAGLLAIRKGDHAGARAAFGQALSLDAGLLEPLTGLAALDVNEGHRDQARSRVEARLRQAPRDSAVLVLAGTIFASTGDQARAEEFLRRAIDADASNLDAYALLGQLYVFQHRLDQALKEFDTLAARQPGTTAVQTVAGMIVLAQGKEDEARRRFEAIVEMDPQAAFASNNLAYMYASRGEQLDRALQLARAAKAARPEHPDINDTLALVYIKKQLGSLAIPLLRLAMEKRPKDPLFHYHMGLACAQTGDIGAARQALEQALKLQPGFKEAGEALKGLRSPG